MARNVHRGDGYGAGRHLRRGWTKVDADRERGRVDGVGRARRAFVGRHGGTRLVQFYRHRRRAGAEVVRAVPDVVVGVGRRWAHFSAVLLLTRRDRMVAGSAATAAAE